MQRLGGPAVKDGWDWLDDEVAKDLMALASSAVGVLDPQFGELDHLWGALLLAAIMTEETDRTQALRRAANFLRTHADPRRLSRAQVDAFEAAVGLTPADRVGAAARRAKAAAALGLSGGAATYTRAGRGAKQGEPRSSEESRLMLAVARALRLEPGIFKASATYAAPRTEDPSLLLGSSDLDLLCGTWRGVTATETLVKSASGRQGPFPTYMTVERVDDTSGPLSGSLRVRWLYDEARTVPAVAATALHLLEGRALRLVCVYEVDVTYLSNLDPVDPRLVHHRGTCLLDLDTHAPSTLSGPYYTDVRTNGVLDFTDKVDAVATNYAAAAGLFAHLSPDELAARRQRSERLQAAVLHADGGPVEEQDLLPLHQALQDTRPATRPPV